MLLPGCALMGAQVDMTPLTTVLYAGISQDFRVSAWKYLDECDLPRASNRSEAW